MKVLEITFEEVLDLIAQAISQLIAEEENPQSFEFYEEVFNLLYNYILKRLAGAKVIVFRDGSVKASFKSVEEFILFLQSLFSIRQILAMAGKRGKAGKKQNFANPTSLR